MATLKEEQQKLLDELDDLLGPEFVVFEPEEEVIMTFKGWPKKEKFPTESGVLVDTMHFPVTVEGEEMILSVSSKRLLRLLIPLLRKGDLIDQTYGILAMGEGMRRKWALRRVG